MRSAHQFLVIRASEVSPAIRECLLTNGILSMPSPKHLNAMHHLARGIVGQRLSTAAARSIWSRFEQAAETSHQTMEASLKNSSHEELKAIGLSNNKVRAIRSLVDYFSTNSVADDELRALTHEQRVSELTNIWGIGDWTVAMLSIFHFGENDVWPWSDGSIQSGVKRLMGWRTVSERRITKFGDRFAPWRSHLALHIWRWLDSKRELRVGMTPFAR